MILAQLIDLLGAVAAIYRALLTTYLVTCLAIQLVSAILLARRPYADTDRPAVLFAHKLYDQITGVISHSGFEHGGLWCWPPSPLVSVTHHDQHHQFFRCNYATHFT